MKEKEKDKHNEERNSQLRTTEENDKYDESKEEKHTERAKERKEQSLEGKSKSKSPGRSKRKHKHKSHRSKTKKHRHKRKKREGTGSRSKKKGKRSKKGKGKRSKRRKRRRKHKLKKRHPYAEFHFNESIAFKDFNIDSVEKRKIRKLKKENEIKECVRKRLAALEERRLLPFYKRFHHWIKSEHPGPKIFRIRSAVFQRHLYLLLAIQGLVSFGLVLRFLITNPYRVPSAFAIHGLYALILSANMLDFFGSIFGFLIAVFLGRSSFFYNKKKIIDKILNEEPLYHLRRGRLKKNRLNKKKKKGQAVPNITDAEGTKLKPKRVRKGKRNAEGKLIRPKVSPRLINGFGYTSWILPQISWFLSVFFTAYYHWLDTFGTAYRIAIDRCDINPRPRYCQDFEAVYYYLVVVNAVTFIIRNILGFCIGLCFNDAPFRKAKTDDPNGQLSSCSDSEMDYSLVPKQLLIPYFAIDRPWVPLWPQSTNINKLAKNNIRKRVQNARERQTDNMLQAFKDIRRANIIVGKKRADVKIRKVKGAQDTMQMPVELMTAKARDWLSGEETDSSQLERTHHRNLDGTAINRHRHPKRRRPGTKPKVKKRKDTLESIDSNSLIFIHAPNSKMRVPIEEKIKPKLQDLSERISTDDGWSGNSASLFETASGSLREEVKVKQQRESDEDYLALMRFADLDDDDYDPDVTINSPNTTGLN